MNAVSDAKQPKQASTTARQRRIPVGSALLYTAGLLLLPFGIVMLLEARIGVGPIDVIVSAASARTTWAHGTSSLLFLAVLLALAFITRCPVKPGTVAVALIIGPLINIVLASGVIAPGDSLIVRSAVFAAGVVVMAFGVAFMIHADHGTGVLELLSLRLASALSTSFPLTRTAVDVLLVAIGAALGGAVGIGTLLFALTFGSMLQTALSLTGKAAALRPVPAR